MAGGSIKFRCYQCNQLIGASRSKAGTKVTCPKCSVGLIVPAPEVEAEVEVEPEPAGSPRGAVAEPTSAFLSGLAAGVPLDIADIRPEDIRVVTGDAWPGASSTAPEEPEEPDAYPVIASSPPAPRAARAPDLDVASLLPLASSTPTGPAPASISAPAAAPPPAQGEAGLPPIRLEPQPLLNERITVRARDLILPRTVVATWSLFVLIAQAMAFIAGLLAGHYIWKIH
jgi:hypothetical protein